MALFHDSANSPASFDTEKRLLIFLRFRSPLVLSESDSVDDAEACAEARDELLSVRRDLERDDDDDDDVVTWMDQHWP
jgi:hypothetical protein